jgi:peptide/nickel transport system permease protein
MTRDLNRLVFRGSAAGCIALIALGILSFFVPTHSAEAIDIAGRFQGPSLAHWMGTDHLGRDIASLIVAGSRTSLSVAVGAVGVGLVVGVLIGLVSAAGARLFDQILMRSMDVVFAFPALLVAILLTATRGPSVSNALIAVAIFNIPVFAQLTRGAARSLWSKDFVQAARVAGKSRGRISFDHILPNLAAPLIVQATIQLSVALGAEAALSFIGLGAPVGTPSWGRMLADAQSMLGWSPWQALFPGLAITLSVLSFSLFGDALRDRLDPKSAMKAPTL